VIKVNLEKAKTIAHEIRRRVRSDEFLPVDGDSAYTSLNETGQALREDIKAKDDAAQIAIDAAADSEELKTILGKL
jgi:hypothetical protein